MDESEDIHEENRLAWDLEKRDQAKAMIFSLIYGAGNKRLAEQLVTFPRNCGQVRKQDYPAEGARGVPQEAKEVHS